MDELAPLIRERLAAGQSVILSPRGVSMLPMLRQGRDSVVLSSPPERLRKYDIPLYLRDDGKYILHSAVKIGESYTCIGDNQFVYEYGVRHESIIGVVTAFTRGEKLRSVKSPGYWLYCRLRHYSRPLRRIWRGLRRRAARLFGSEGKEV
jgi:hypothetical protein